MREEWQELVDEAVGAQESFTFVTPNFAKFNVGNWLPQRMQDGSPALQQTADYVALRCAEQATSLRLRFAIPPSTDYSSFISKAVAQIGHPYEADLTDYAVSMLSLTGELTRYRHVAGTDRWYKFVSFFFGAEVRCSNLYTDNYIRFEKKPLGELLHLGGSWYKTTHVSLVINYRQLRFNLKPRLGQTYMERVFELLNQYKPVNLVLHEVQLMEGLDSAQIQYKTLSGIDYHHSATADLGRFNYEG